jgi:hypothetical protein
MMTAYGTPAMEAAAFELGAKRVMGRPLDMGEIGPLVRDFLQSKG